MYTALRITHRIWTGWLNALPRAVDPAVLFRDALEDILRIPLLHLAENIVHLDEREKRITKTSY